MESSSSNKNYDHSFKILLIGDSGVGKTSLLNSFISNFQSDIPPTIGVDFEIKHLTVGTKKLKLTIWDTAGQERFRTLTSSYYRGAHGIVLVYDVTRRETFTNLSDIWAKEIELYSTNEKCVKILVGNKVDKETKRLVMREEGIALAQKLGCLFVESSALTGENVEKCFEELASKIMEVPSLLEEGSANTRRIVPEQKQEPEQNQRYDHSFKILLIGDSGVGKSSLLNSFISNFQSDIPPTIGVDFEIKHLTVGTKKLKLTIWDTAGQERFNTLTSSYYRGAHGIILVYDVTRRETLTNLLDIWVKEIELYSTNEKCVKILVGNKVDKETERLVTREEGIALAQKLGCLFVESSALTGENVEKCFEELASKIVLEQKHEPEQKQELEQKQEPEQKQVYNETPMAGYRADEPCIVEPVCRIL